MNVSNFIGFICIINENRDDVSQINQPNSVMIWVDYILQQIGLRLLFGLVELSFHGGVLVGQPADGEFLGLVVGQAQVILGTQEIGLGLLQEVYRLVDVLDSLLELLTGQTVVSAELLLKSFSLVSKLVTSTSLLWAIASWRL